tara:strand:- start:67 stop:363 length:297 start_codon:yes stop_codon:yes gene_type:complete
MGWPTPKECSKRFYECVVKDDCADEATASVFGFDTFWYVMSNQPVPCQAQFSLLRERVVDLLLTHGHEVIGDALESNRFREFIGSEFRWVVLPILLKR